MATETCNISFKVDYTSSKPIKSVIAYYKNKNGSPSDPYSEYNINPIPSSSDTVKLPFIQDEGDYELIVELMDEDGVIAKETSSFKIGNCSGDKPKVSIKWRDNSGTEDRICTTSNCEEYVISANYSDADNNINTVEVFISQDNGITWSSIISNLSGSTTFGTGALSTIGKRLFKVVVTDLSGNVTESNWLSYTKEKEQLSICKQLYNFKNSRLDVDSLPVTKDWVTATVDVDASAVGVSMSLSHEIYYRRCNDLFLNRVQVIGTKNEILQDFEVPNDLQSGITGYKSVPFTYTPQVAGQLKVRISEYTSFAMADDTPAYLHIDSQLLFLDEGEICSSISAEHNFSIYRGTDCIESD